MVIGCVVVLAGVVIGWYTVAGSGIHRRPYGKGDTRARTAINGESPLDSPWEMRDWSRGTSSAPAAALTVLTPAHRLRLRPFGSTPEVLR